MFQIFLMKNNFFSFKSPLKYRHCNFLKLSIEIFRTWAISIVCFQIILYCFYCLIWLIFTDFNFIHWVSRRGKVSRNQISYSNDSGYIKKLTFWCVEGVFCVQKKNPRSDFKFRNLNYKIKQTRSNFWVVPKI